MSLYHSEPPKGALVDKVVVITGGASGIGASLVEYCFHEGALVCFADVAVEAGETLAKSLNASSFSEKPRAVFCQTDVAKYESVLDLFDTAFKTYGYIDHVVAVAGIVDKGNPLDYNLTLETVRDPPSTKVIDVNLLGCLYVARIASVYLRQNRPPNVDRSITLFSSMAGRREVPGVVTYQASKHGVMGLMRSLRLHLSSPMHNIRINTICPCMTVTPMVGEISEWYRSANLPVSTSMDVAKATAAVCADSKLHGKTVCIEGGRAWEVETNIEKLEPQVIGEEFSKAMVRAQELLIQSSGGDVSWLQLRNEHNSAKA